MKKQSNILSVLKSLGIEPKLFLIIFIGIFISGILLGFLVKNTLIKKKKPQPKIEIIHTEEIPQIEIKEEQEEIFVPTPFNKYKVILDKKPTTPVIALIIDDMGVNMVNTQKILSLPYLLTPSYLTHSPNLASQVDFARTKGKEILLHIPMEALNNTYDYGPEYLSTEESSEANIALLEKMLARAEGYVGINNHMGSKFTANTPLMSGVIEHLSNKGLMFVDSLTTPKYKSKEIVKHVKLPYARRDIFLDDDNDKESIKKSLISLERIAKKRGYAVAIGHPRENTIEILEEWLPTLKEKGITLVPISYIAEIKK